MKKVKKEMFFLFRLFADIWWFGNMPLGLALLLTYIFSDGFSSLWVSILLLVLFFVITYSSISFLFAVVIYFTKLNRLDEKWKRLEKIGFYLYIVGTILLLLSIALVWSKKVNLSQSTFLQIGQFIFSYFSLVFFPASVNSTLESLRKKQF